MHAPATDTAPPTAVQRWSASDYAKNGRFVQDLAGPIFAMLAPKPGLLTFSPGIDNVDWPSRQCGKTHGLPDNGPAA